MPLCTKKCCQQYDYDDRNLDREHHLAKKRVARPHRDRDPGSRTDSKESIYPPLGGARGFECSSLQFYRIFRLEQNCIHSLI